MGFTSQDDLIDQLSSNGNYLRVDNAKITSPVHTAGGWHCLAGLNGYPNATTYPSAQDLVFQSCSELGGDSASASLFGIRNGGLPGSCPRPPGFWATRAIRSSCATNARTN